VETRRLANASGVRGASAAGFERAVHGQGFISSYTPAISVHMKRGSSRRPSDQRLVRCVTLVNYRSLRILIRRQVHIEHSEYMCTLTEEDKNEF
jgi:hypothetical protein